jgi:hypothetical protein
LDFAEVAMNGKFAQVHVSLPAASQPMAALARVQTADLAVVDETPVGMTLAVPPGKGYLASAVAMDGAPIGLPTRFDVADDTDVVTVRLAAPPPLSAEEPAGGAIFTMDVAAAAAAPVTVFSAPSGIELKAAPARRATGVLGSILSPIGAAAGAALAGLGRRVRRAEVYRESSAKTAPTALSIHIERNDLKTAGIVTADDEVERESFPDESRKEPLATGAPAAPTFDILRRDLKAVGSFRADNSAVLGPFLPAVSEDQIQESSLPGPNLSTLMSGHQSETRDSDWFLGFPGPDGSRRYAVVPFDVRGELRRPPSVTWTRAATPGLFLPLFYFDDPAIDALQAALRYKQLAIARPFARKIIADLAESGVREKMRSPLGAALGGLVLLNEAPDRLKQFESWTVSLFNGFPSIPDSLPLRAELLARLGRHREAREVLRQLPERGPPWTRKGLQILTDRLSFYELTEEQHSEEFHATVRWYQNLLARAHPACVFCVIDEESSSV